MQAAILGYNIPHYNGPVGAGPTGSLRPKFLACNATDQAQKCKSLDIWKQNKISSETDGNTTWADQGFNIEYFYTSENGIQAGLFRHQSGAFMLAFAGTDFSRTNDRMRDLGLALGAPIYDDQYQTIAKSVTARMEALDADPLLDLAVTGHSLGGFEAQVYAVINTVNRVVTFSAPGAGASLQNRRSATLERDMKNHVREGDVVPLAGGKRYGETLIHTATKFDPSSVNQSRVAYEKGWIFAQHNKGKFLGHLKTKKPPYGHINFRNVRLQSHQRSGGLKPCARGSVYPTVLTLTMGLCPLATTFNFTRNGYLTNKRAIEPMQVCVGARRRGEPVIMGQCTGAANQIWEHRGDDRLRNKETGHCLDFARGRKHKNKLITWNCNDGLNQKWKFL